MRTDLVRSGVSLALALMIAVGSPLAGAQSPTFRFSQEAGAALRTLWETSVRIGQERVACLAARVDGDTVFVTRVLPLPVTDADSLGAAARASIDRCGPPEWQGTVHTHIAEYRDGEPSRRFSGQDRVVMQMWYARWRADGVFCLVYSAERARCEADGVVGGLRGARPRVVR